MKYIKQLFFLNLYDYEHIKFRFPIGMIVTFMAVVLCLGAFYITYRRRYTYALYGQLIRHSAISPDSAKTLKELHLLDYKAVKRALSRSGQLSFAVKRVNEEKPTYEEARKRGFKYKKIDFETERFYINPDAANIVRKAEGAPTPAWWKPALASLAILIVFSIILICLPDLLEVIDFWVA